MSGVARFEPYAPPRPSIAEVCRDLDYDISQLGVLRRENDALRKNEQKLRREAANTLACAESERAESARLRRENQRLSNELATATAFQTSGRMSP